MVLFLFCSLLIKVNLTYFPTLYLIIYIRLYLLFNKYMKSIMVYSAALQSINVHLIKIVCIKYLV